MRLLVVTIVYIIFLPVSSMAQKKSSLLKWEANNPLKWVHFKGLPDASDVVHAAVTYAGIELSIENHQPENGTTTFGASAVFDQQQSWVHPTDKDERVLAHEQLHFDITEVYARKLQNKLNSLNLNKKRDRARIIKLQQYYNQQQLVAQAQFDNETLHGINSDKEKIWRSKVQQELKLPGNKLTLLPQDMHLKQPTKPPLSKANHSHSASVRN